MSGPVQATTRQLDETTLFDLIGRLYVSWQLRIRDYDALMTQAQGQAKTITGLIGEKDTLLRRVAELEAQMAEQVPIDKVKPEKKT